MNINGTANNIIEEWQSYGSTNFGFHGKPSTEFIGWWHLTPNKIMHLEEGAFFLLSIPPESKYVNKETINVRCAFMNRVYGAVIRTKRLEFPDNGKSVHDRAVNYLIHHNGITRNGLQYIELACVLCRYPHRVDYVTAMLSYTEVLGHVKKGGGLDIVILDYPTPAKSTNTVLLKWDEIHSMQLFAERQRGDAYPTIELTKRNSEHSYADEIANYFEDVKDDEFGMTQLALAFERERTRILVKEVNKLKTMKTVNVQADEDLLIAFYKHYTSFQSLDRLLDPDIADRLYSEIERGFPLHFMVIRSIIFGSEAHYPSRQKRHDYKDKERSLINYFFALIRVRDSTCLVHWAMVGTLGMLSKGGI
jgi:hypothetical protein